MRQARIETESGKLWGIATEDEHGWWSLIKEDGYYVPEATDVHNAREIRIGRGCLESYLSGFRGLKPPIMEQLSGRINP